MIPNLTGPHMFQPGVKWKKNTQLIVVTFRSTLSPQRGGKKVTCTSWATILGSRFFLLGEQDEDFLFVCTILLGKLLGNLVDKSNKIWSWTKCTMKSGKEIWRHCIECGSMWNVPDFLSISLPKYRDLWCHYYGQSFHVDKILVY